MSGISQQARVSVYLRNDAQIDGAEMASLVRAAGSRRPEAAVSARVAEFADARDPQVARIARGQIPGAERLFTPGDLAALRRRVGLVQDPAYATRFQSGVERAAHAPVRQGNDLQFLVEGREAYPEIRRMIQSAQDTIDMEFFTLHDDATGRAVAEDLIAAHRRGVRINFLLDRALASTSPELIQHLRDSGVPIRYFENGHRNPLLNIADTIDHRKILLVDGREGITGGMNLGEPYEKYWHDVMVRVRGPVLNDIYREFATNWTASGGTFPSDAVGLARQRALPVGDVSAAVHVTTPSSHQAESGMFAAIDQARDHIYVNCPYFIDQPFVDKLIAAAQRGVRVVAVIPNMTDVKVVDRINQTRIDDMLAAGIQVRTYDSTNPDLAEVDFMKIHLNHAKILTVDGVYTSIGTVNIDHRALRSNQEINLSVTSADFAHDIERRFFHSDAIGGRVTPAAASEHGWHYPIKRWVLDRIAPLL